MRAEDVGVGPSTFADGTWEWTGVGNVELDGEGIWDVIEDAASSNDDRLDCLFSRAIFAGIGDGGAMAGEGEGGASVGFFLNILPKSFRAPERSGCAGPAEAAAGMVECGVGVD